MISRYLLATISALCMRGGQALSTNISGRFRAHSSSARRSSGTSTWRPSGGTHSPSREEAESVPIALQNLATVTATMVAVTATKEEAGAVFGRDWRTEGGSLAAAGLLALSLFFANPAEGSAADAGMPGSGPGCSTSANPSYSMVSCERVGLDRSGRLLGCSSSENCISTSAVKTPGKLGSPWEYARQTDDADRAFASLVKAVERTSDVTMKTVDNKEHYILAQFPSKVPPGSVDSVEFLVKPADQIVLYRSVSRDTLFLYPLQQPVSDQGKIKERLEGIRKELGWGMYTYQGE